MANELKMAKVNAIHTLRQAGWSARKIAQELGIDRETVRRHLELPEAGNSKPAKAPTGSDAGAAAPERVEVGGESSLPEASRSDCQRWREVIETKLDAGLSAKRIHQDLTSEHGFTGSYWSVQRFVRALSAKTPLPFRRMECAPGAEAQVDFGTGAPIVTPDGKRRRPWVLRVVLSHSRKAYSEAVYRQTTDSFLATLENAFWHFGGVPATVVIDNLKAAVDKADWYDPELHPKIQSFAQHYGTTILPTKPRTPRHKGKIENGVGYVKKNALRGRIFESLSAENAHLLEWETTVADTRIHGTTKKQVQRVFDEIERAVLKPLPVEHFPQFREGRRSVNRDGHVEVDKAYYTAPAEYVGRRVWVRWDSRLVRIFNWRFEQVALHVKLEPGRFSTDPAHLPKEKISGIEKGATYLLSKAGAIGPHASTWAAQMLENRGIEGVRVLMGLVALAGRHHTQAIDRACQTALTYGAFRLQTIRQLIKRKEPHEQQLSFLEEHPIIRSLEEYSAIVERAFSQEGG
jgi:transposase